MTIELLRAFKYPYYYAYKPGTILLSDLYEAQSP